MQNPVTASGIFLGKGIGGRFARGVVWTAALLALAGCGPRDHGAPSGEAARPEIARPKTYPVLQLMPDSADIALAIPSISKTFHQVETFLLRGSPASLNMEAEIKVAVRQAALALGVPDTYTPEDIALAKGISPDEPLGVFIAFEPRAQAATDSDAGERESETMTPDAVPQIPESPTAAPEASAVSFTADATRPAQWMSSFPADWGTPWRVVADGEMVAVFPVAKREDAERSVAEWVGERRWNKEEHPALKTTIMSDSAGLMAYFFADKHLVIGNSPRMVKEVADRMTSPLELRYGTEACPPDDEYEIAQLVRVDKLPWVAEELARSRQRVAAGTSMEGGAPVGEQSHDRNDPAVVTWIVGQDRLTVRARADSQAHPQYREWIGPAKKLRHVNMLPAGTMAFMSFNVSESLKQRLLEEFEVRTSGGTEPPFTLMAPSIRKVAEMMEGEITIGMTSVERDLAMSVALVEFKNGEEARKALREMGFMPFVESTYNGIEICTLPIPAATPYQVRYALPGNTLIFATNLDQLKTLIDTVLQNKSTNFAGRLDPPLDAEQPLWSAMVAGHSFLEEGLLPTLYSQGMLTADGQEWLSETFEKVREARMTFQPSGDWH